MHDFSKYAARQVIVLEREARTREDKDTELILYEAAVKLLLLRVNRMSEKLKETD